jgi:prepilin-type N-terminal cleavage/methylation domain-containing protein
MRTKGFTMIELLIVIAVIGILAVAVLAAINPIEQINRGHDTGSVSDAEQLIGAIDRYYTAHGYYPWMIGETDDTNLPRSWDEADQQEDSDGCNILTKLGVTEGSCIGSEEIKLSFVSRISATDYNDLWIYLGSDPGDSVYLCFKPKSGAFATEAGDRCDETETDLPPDFPDNACDNDSDCGTLGNCYCLP